LKIGRFALAVTADNLRRLARNLGSRSPITKPAG
jgi:hypothetical protein